jgi:DNA-binding transcriptional ArsR family regulator
MDTGPKIAQVAALVGDPARANILASLMDGRALTASELAYISGVAPQTASGHLAKLSDAQLLAVERQGRNRYFKLASSHVGRMLEGLMVVAQEGPARRQHRWRGGDALRTARTCYDHMAGRIAVGIADSLITNAHDDDGGKVTDAGRTFLEGVGLTWPRHRSARCSAALVSIGVSGAHILPASWVAPFSGTPAVVDGLNVSRRAGRLRSQPQAIKGLPKRSASYLSRR